MRFSQCWRCVPQYWPYNRFIGKIPDLNRSTLMWAMRFEGNDFQQFPNSLPPDLTLGS